MVYISITLYMCFAIFKQMSVIALSESHPEVISVKHTINEMETIARLSVNIVINNTETRFDLQSVEGYFAGENTKVYMLNKTKYYELENIMKEVNISFYQDRNTLSSLSHVINKRGVSEFNGVIDSDKIISPLTERIRKRYNIPSHLYSQADNDFENYHIIRQKHIRVKRLTEEERQDSKYGITKMIFPEILVFVDKSLLQHFGNNTVKTLVYILTMLNGADLYFRTIRDTEIRLNIAGIVLCQDNIIKEDNFTVSDGTFWRFGNFLYQQTKFIVRRNYDIAILIGTNSHVIGGVLGKGTINGACSSNPKTASVSSIALVLDKDLSGIRTTAHELAHLFGVRHDGDAYKNVFINETCPFEDGYAMSYRKYNKNKFLFSKCSQKVMNDFFSLKAADCLRNNPAENRRDKQILRILPGKYMSIDEQCQKLGYLRALRIDKNVCVGITCIKKGITKRKKFHHAYFFNVAALEGAPCGSNKYCFKGECVKIEVDHDGTIDVDLFLTSYTTRRPLDEVKQNLKLDLNSFSLKPTGNLINLLVAAAVKYLYDFYLGF